MNQNKVFLFLLGLFWLSVPLADLVGNVLLKDNFFSFRAWESVVANGSARGPFRPNYHFEKMIFGDLANMLKVRKFRDYRKQIFTTDRNGFRNQEFPADTKFKVVVSGDSDMAGSSLSDDYIFACVLSKELKEPVFNYAPWSPLMFLRDVRMKNAGTKILIWERVERTLYGAAFKKYLNLPKVANEIRYDIGFTDHFTPSSSVKHLNVSELLARQLYYETKYLLVGNRSKYIAHVDSGSGMMFYSPGVAMLPYGADARGLATILTAIKRVNDLLADRGIILVFIPLPDKENVYKFLLPPQISGVRSENNFLIQLHKGLDKIGVFNVPLYQHFKESALAGESLYFLDDTHWNEKGVEEAVKLTVEELRTQYITKNVLSFVPPLQN